MKGEMVKVQKHIGKWYILFIHCFFLKQILGRLHQSCSYYSTWFSSKGEVWGPEDGGILKGINASLRQDCGITDIALGQWLLKPLSKLHWQYCYVFRNGLSLHYSRYHHKPSVHYLWGCSFSVFLLVSYKPDKITDGSFYPIFLSAICRLNRPHKKEFISSRCFLDQNQEELDQIHVLFLSLFPSGFTPQTNTCHH